MRLGRTFIGCILTICVQFTAQPTVQGQDPLRSITASTQVRKISFRYPEGNPTFEDDQLLEQIVTTAPAFWDRFDRLNPFTRTDTHPFDPVELQKDVVRLRRFFQRNGFPTPRISYSASQYDAARDRIHVIFTIWEGAPLFVQDIRFFDPDSAYIAPQLPEPLQSPWMRFRDGIRRGIGARYTEVERIRVQDQVLNWFQSHGYAFASVDARTRVDTTQRTVDLNLFVDRGPRGVIASIQIEGNETISEAVLLRELPFKPGDTFSIAALRQGQQELFGLNLFRVALADVPDQPRDSTVDVRIRVTEAKRRYLTAETGYSRENGIGVQGEWLNRNFLGAARNLSLNLQARTGLLSATSSFNAVNVVGRLPARLFRASVSIRQPYLFTTRLSGLFSPFIEFQNDPQLPASLEFLDINRREFGLNATLIYETLPFRPISFEYTLSQLLSRAGQSTFSPTRDLYNQSTLEISATFGKANNFLDPSRGVLIKPFIETAGRLFSSGLQYNKAGLEVVAYLPLTRRLNLSGRLFGGVVLPFGESRRGLAKRVCTLPDGRDRSSPAEYSRCLQFENRFDPVFFYAGGGNDVRGWSFQLLGPKIARADTLKENGEIVVDDNGQPTFTGFFYERVGGELKQIGNFELRTRIPGMGPDWQGAVFIDFGQVSNRTLRLRDFRYAAGAGLRYRTIVGFIRLDVAYKINPSSADLTDPEDVFRFVNGLSEIPPKEKFLRRFGLHLSIGQAF